MDVLLHSDEDHFVLNMQALHNVHLLRTVIPDQYFNVPEVVDDWVNFHAAQVGILSNKES